MSSEQTGRRIRVRNPVGRARVTHEPPLAQEKPPVVRDVVVGLVGGEPTHSTSPALRKPVTEREWERLGALARDRLDFCLLNVRWPVVEDGLVLTAERPVLRDVFRLYGERTRAHPEFDDLRAWLGKVRERHEGDPCLITWAPNLAVWYAPGRVIHAFRPLLRDAVREGLRQALLGRLTRPDGHAGNVAHHAWNLQRAAVSWQDEVLAMAALSTFCGMGSEEALDMLRELGRDADPRSVTGEYVRCCKAMRCGGWPVDGQGDQHE